MLERYFRRPNKIRGIRLSPIGEGIERYVFRMAEQGYSPRTVRRRVQVLMHFGRFVRKRGARTWADLPACARAFMQIWLPKHLSKLNTQRSQEELASQSRLAVEQLVQLLVSDFTGLDGSGSPQEPYFKEVPGFFDYLRGERGLREASIRLYGHHLRQFQGYLTKIHVDDLGALSPAILDSFVLERSGLVGQRSLCNLCGILRVFLRYLWREQKVQRDLSSIVECPLGYRLSSIPRSIETKEVGRMLAAVARTTPIGKRDYAILLLLVAYGLRGHEVARLKLEHLDWQNERLRIPERKAGHSSVYPLSATIGEAIVDYLKHGRPKTSERYVFLKSRAPYSPLRGTVISKRTSIYLRKAGISVSRPGSHTLRHTCVQRLVDANFSLKVIGDYIGHRAASSTQIYSKVAIEALREVALGDGEEIL